MSHETVEQLPYEVHTPDTFFVLVDDSAPEKVRTVTRKQSEHWLEKTGEADLPARLPIQHVGSNAVCSRISKLEHPVRATYCAPGRNRTSDLHLCLSAVRFSHQRQTARRLRLPEATLS